MRFGSSENATRTHGPRFPEFLSVRDVQSNCDGQNACTYCQQRSIIVPLLPLGQLRVKNDRQKIITGICSMMSDSVVCTFCAACSLQVKSGTRFPGRNAVTKAAPSGRTKRTFSLASSIIDTDRRNVFRLYRLRA
jgi:hypothetical protein